MSKYLSLEDQNIFVEKSCESFLINRAKVIGSFMETLIPSASNRFKWTISSAKHRKAKVSALIPKT